jgi:hypothetical protein
MMKIYPICISGSGASPDEECGGAYRCGGNLSMKILVQVIVDPENGNPAVIKPITEFRREDLSSSTLGLTIKESKLLLKNVQSEFVTQQVEQYIGKHKTCDQCHKELKIKGHTEVRHQIFLKMYCLCMPIFQVYFTPPIR